MNEFYKANLHYLLNVILLGHSPSNINEKDKRLDGERHPGKANVGAIPIK